MGGVAEFAAFNEWLGLVRARFKHVLVITGNHEYKLLGGTDKREFTAEDVAAQQTLARSPDLRAALQHLLSNATVLEHTLVEVLGLRVYGAGWVPFVQAKNPDMADGRGVCPELLEAAGPRETVHRFGEIPPCDVLLARGAPAGLLASALTFSFCQTHGPSRGVFDWMEGTGRWWGSSKALTNRILEVRPGVHLHGHLHEQRGYWQRTAAGYSGGVEYQRVAGQPWPENQSPAPSLDFPCQVVSCAALKNHPKLDRLKEQLVGLPRVIVAERTSIADPWSFRVVEK